MESMIGRSGKICRNERRNRNNYDRKRHIFKMLILCLTFFIFISGSSFAVDGTSDSNRLKSEHSFEIGAVSSYFEYTEPHDIEISGYMAGVNGKYTFCSSTGFVFSAELEYTGGLDTEYDGNTWDQTILREDSKDWIVESRILVGGRLKLDEHSIINPYFGFGGRYWYNNIDGASSYKRITEYFYLPVGTNFTYNVSENFKLGVTLEFDIFLWGQNKSYLSDVDPGFNDVELDQHSGYGLRASLPFFYKSVRIEPYIYYWNINESGEEILKYNGRPLYYVVEPDNETTVCGIRLTYLF